MVYRSTNLTAKLVVVLLLAGGLLDKRRQRVTTVNQALFDSSDLLGSAFLVFVLYLTVDRNT